MIAIAVTIPGMLLITFAGSPGSQAAERHKLQLDDYGRPLLPIYFSDGSKSLMLLDTSARRTGLKNKLAEKHAAQVHDFSSIRHFSAAGLTERPYATLYDLSLFGRKIEKNTIALYADNAMHDGLVGFDIYSWHILRFHAKDQAIELQPNTGDVGRAGWQVIAGRYNRHLGIMLTTDYNGQEFEVLLATGTSRSLIDGNAARKLVSAGVVKKPDGGETAAMGIDARPRGLTYTVMPDFRIGPWNLGDLPVLVTNLPSRDATGYVNSNFIMIGADVLMNQDIALDFRDFQVWVPGDEQTQASRVLTSSGVK